MFRLFEKLLRTKLGNKVVKLVLPTKIIHDHIMVDGVVYSTEDTKLLCWLPNGREIRMCQKGGMVLCEHFRPDGHIDDCGKLHREEVFKIIKIVYDLEEEVMNAGGTTLF